MMRAPCDSDSEQCNNIQYMPDDGGFYPKCLTVLQLHTYFRKGGPMGTKPLILTMAVLHWAMNFTENTNFGRLIEETELFPMFGSLCFREQWLQKNHHFFCDRIREQSTSDACKLVHFSLKIFPAVSSTSSFLGSCFTKWLMHFSCISKKTNRPGVLL